jgi:hypothetical protein
VKLKKYFGCSSKKIMFDYENYCTCKKVDQLDLQKLGRFEDIDAKIKPVDDIESSKTRGTRNYR